MTRSFVVPPIEMQESQARGWGTPPPDDVKAVELAPPGGPIVSRSVLSLLGHPITIVEHRSFIDRDRERLFAGGETLFAVNPNTGHAVRIVNVTP